MFEKIVEKCVKSNTHLTLAMLITYNPYFLFIMRLFFCKKQEKLILKHIVNNPTFMRINPLFKIYYVDIWRVNTFGGFLFLIKGHLVIISYPC